MGGGESSPNALDRSKPSALFLRVGVARDEQHYKSGACVSDEREFVFGASGACADVHAYEDGAPCVLPQHSAALPIVAL